MENTHYLRSLFSPESIAVIGASEKPRSVGGMVFQNLLKSGFAGRLSAINPKHKTLFGNPCYSSIEALEKVPELAIIATPSATLPEVMAQCGRAGVKAAAVLSAPVDGRANHASIDMEMLRLARKYGMRFIGPNCLGIIRPSDNMNASFAQSPVIEGGISLISQSGGVAAAVLDWAHSNNIGFANVVTMGSSLDLDFGEILDFLANDFRTESIFMYVEGIRDSRRFMSSLRSTARIKPVMLIKVGRHPSSSLAARAHTGARVGEDAVFNAALRRAGVVRLYSMEHLYAATNALFQHLQPRGKRLSIISNAGGPGVMATDRAADLDIPLAWVSPDSIENLSEINHGAHFVANPLDLLGNAGPDEYRRALEVLLADQNVDGLLVVHVPLAIADSDEVAQVVIEIAQTARKPIVCCWMGGKLAERGRERLKAAGLSAFTTPEPAVELFSHIADFFRNQKLLMQVPTAQSQETGSDINAAREFVAGLQARQCWRLEESDARHLLELFAIDVADNNSQRGPGRLLSLLVSRDNIFGPVITLREIGPHASRAARSVGLPPLNRFLARDMLRAPQLSDLLADLPDMASINITALENLLLAVSEMICEIACLNELAINPLFVNKEGIAAIRYKVEINDYPLIVDRFDHMAIHPYPNQLRHTVHIKSGQLVLIRPVRPEDADIENDFVRSLSDETRYFRFMNAIKELPPTTIARLTQIDYDRDMALLATINFDNTEQVIGACRYSTNPDAQSCEFAIVVHDDFQNQGVAGILMSDLIAVAKKRGFHSINGVVLAENVHMLNFIQRRGFIIKNNPSDSKQKLTTLNLLEWQANAQEHHD